MIAAFVRRDATPGLLEREIEQRRDLASQWPLEIRQHRMRDGSRPEPQANLEDRNRQQDGCRHCGCVRKQPSHLIRGATSSSIFSPAGNLKALYDQLHNLTDIAEATRILALHEFDFLGDSGCNVRRSGHREGRARERGRKGTRPARDRF